MLYIMHPALKKGPLFTKNTPHFPLFFTKHTPHISFPAYGPGGSVCLLVATLSSAKTDEPIEMTVCGLGCAPGTTYWAGGVAQRLAAFVA